MGRASQPISVKFHFTSFGVFRVVTLRIIPAPSSSFNLMERTLGVIPGIVLRSSLNLSVFLMAMSLITRRAHFFPRTPRLVAIGQFAKGAAGTMGIPSIQNFNGLFGLAIPRERIGEYLSAYFVYQPFLDCAEGFEIHPFMAKPKSEDDKRPNIESVDVGSVQQSEKRPRPRIETLADLIFGVSLGIGSLVLIGNSPASSGEINGHIAAFGFTFVLIITAWIIYTTDMSVLPVETRAVTFLNVVLLLMVALVPYLLNGVESVNTALNVSQDPIRDYFSTLFAADLAGILFILATFAHVISKEEKRLVAPEFATLFRNGRNRMAVLGVIMAVTVLPIFWQVTWFGIPLRMYLWYLPLVSYWVGRALRPDSRTYRISEDVA
jgi:uncharacterized membrane protein